MKDRNILIILGATAVGKTKLAVHLAHLLNAEIISADSRQIYKNMDIGTGKDLSEYCIHNTVIPYHLIDILNAGDKYNVSQYQNDFYKAFNDIMLRERLPILCGGTGMYIHSLLQNYQFTAIPKDDLLRSSLENLEVKTLIEKLNLYPNEYTAQADTSTKKRLIRAIEIAEYLVHNKFQKKVKNTLKPLVIGLFDDVETRRSKILQRLNNRIEQGLIEEVKLLLTNGVSREMLYFYGLEYKFVLAYLENQISFVEFKEQLYFAICQYAKRQMTFFRKMEKDGVEIHWIKQNPNFDVVFNQASQLISPYFQNK